MDETLVEKQIEMLQSAKAARTPRQRRDYAKEVAGLEAYCLAVVDITTAGVPSEFGKGMISMAQAILKKIAAPEQEDVVENNHHEPIDPELVEDEALDIRRPDVPITVEEIAALGPEEAKKVIDSREQIIETLRAASIRQTHPSDWILNKDREGRVRAYLEDGGCQRLMDLWGISVDNITTPERENAKDGDSYAYSIMGDGHCSVTRRSVQRETGTRYSTEKYAMDKPAGIQREVAVKKAARANLEGRIVRNLAGLNNVPLEELILVTGDKDFEKKASKGHGYGSQSERQGATADHGLAPAEYPICEPCLALKPSKTTTMVFKKEGAKGPYWYCPNWKLHEKQKSFVDHAKLMEQIEKERANKAPAAADEPREPGAEG